MNKQQVLQTIRDVGIIPVVRAESADEAIMAIEAIREGGISILEITMTVPGAVVLIDNLWQRYGSEALVGAGTVLDGETARACIEAGAQFVVSPSLNVETIEVCRQNDVAVLPGALTPTEVVEAWSAGADFVKVFPIAAVGGAKYLKLVKGPLPHIKIIPTGGVDQTMAGELIKAGAEAVGVGSDLADASAAREGRASDITAAARKYLSIAAEARQK